MKEQINHSEKTKTPCCGFEWSYDNTLWSLNTGPILWNPWKLQVQCHNCGAVFDYRNAKPCQSANTAKDATS